MTPVADRTSRTKLAAGLLLAGTFVAGAIAGAGLLVAFGPRPPGPPGGLGSLEELDLSAAQEAKARALHERFRPRLEAIFRETMPKVQAVQVEIESELRSLLTPEQQRKLDAMRAARPFLPPGMAPGGLPPPPPPGFGPPGMAPPGPP
ncbi:MAG: hypothetical protein HY903_02985 [Deltaproteobacteria bacterium]|nr:hypothetical protein [Deltaproteobacteria bacterium]